MTKARARQRVEKLKKVINYHRYLYHVLDRQEISEAALDSLKKELFDLEQQFPELVTPDSPTQRVAGRPLKKFEKTKHPAPMLSFNDAFSQKDMEDWLARISRLLTEEEIFKLDFFCELKIDGLAIELIYENEILKIGSTRGDGVIGENITQNLKTVEPIPLRLRGKEHILRELAKEKLPKISDILKQKGLKEAVARGEVFCSKKEFVKVNKEQDARGLPFFANPRNMAAGSVRQLDPKVTAVRRLDSFAYDLVADFGQDTHEEEHKILRAFGLKVNSHNKYCKDLKEVFKFHEYWQKNREKLDYEVDGIVVIVNNNRIFEKLGVAGKAPRGAIAFKFALKQATTIIENIIVQVGRTGVITPVAALRPVEVGGVTISRATLHNEDEILRLDARIGDTVIVGRAGDVIPDIVKVLPDLRTGKEKNFHMPAICPSCGSKLLRSAGEASWRCSNQNCFAQKREYFYHFVSRKAFDIVGLGPKIIDRLIDGGLVSDPADLFKLKEGDILPLERFAEKSAQNLISAIQSKKRITLPRFILALGIRNVGEETARDLADYFGSIKKLAAVSLEDLQKIQDVGPVVAGSIRDWFGEKKNLKFLDELEKTGVKIGSHKVAAKNEKLKGLTFVLTGVLENMTRDQVKETIRLFGGEVSESVSENTDYLVAGSDPGSKLIKAKKLGVRIIDERELLTMVKEG